MQLNKNKQLIRIKKYMRTKQHNEQLNKKENNNQVAVNIEEITKYNYNIRNGAK